MWTCISGACPLKVYVCVVVNFNHPHVHVRMTSHQPWPYKLLWVSLKKLGPVVFNKCWYRPVQMIHKFIFSVVVVVVVVVLDWAFSTLISDTYYSYLPMKCMGRTTLYWYNTGTDWPMSHDIFKWCLFSSERLVLSGVMLFPRDQICSRSIAALYILANVLH